MPTHPGVHSEFRYEFFGTDERRIIFRFASQFYVTKAIQPFTIGNMAVRSLLMRPADLLAQMMNIDREFIVLLM